jgi:FAD-linked sulfhydryl oxidase
MPPPTPEELGRAGWTVLHATAAVFPNHPTQKQMESLRTFITSWSEVYPCSHCAYHMRQQLKQKPPVVTNKREASRFVCELHNSVNEMLGRPTYNCDPELVLKQWHPTYPDMEDAPSIEEQIELQKKADAAKANKIPGTGWSGRAAAPQKDGGAEDIDAVLAKLKACQVYCPENDKKKL